MLPQNVFDEFMTEVTSRVRTVEQGPSVYRTLVALASIYQELADSLVLEVYSASGVNGRQCLTCAAGCNICCHVPSEVRSKDKRNFSMSYLDVIWLIENYDNIKMADPFLYRKVIAAVEAAKCTEYLQPCPYLTASGRCSIYLYRPLPCKIWFSYDISLCIRNRDLGYEANVNPYTDLSRSIGTAFAQPFANYVQRIDPDRNFWGYDFLGVFEEIAKLDAQRLFGTLRAKIDAGELASWNPSI